MNLIKTEAQRDTANFILQFVVATAVIIMAAACLWVVSTFKLEERNFSALQLFLGAALAWMGSLISFCFPNSIGAAKQQDTIAKLAGTSPPPGAAQITATPDVDISLREPAP